MYPILALPVDQKEQLYRQELSLYRSLFRIYHNLCHASLEQVCREDIAFYFQLTQQTPDRVVGHLRTKRILFLFHVQVPQASCILL